MQMNRRRFLEISGHSALGIACASAIGTANCACGETPPAGQQKAVALTIGLNSVSGEHYVDEAGKPWTGDLLGCENDAKDMGLIATEARFQTQTLLTKNATRAAVLEALTQAAKTVTADGIFMIAYSGHGGQVPEDPARRDEYDGHDETWCLYDGELLDDELYDAWKQFPAGSRILAFSDSCHSGTVIKMMPLYDLLAAASQMDEAMAIESPRGASAFAGPMTRPVTTAPRYRAMPPEVAESTYAKNKAFYEKLRSNTPPEGSAELKASALLISGCQDNQLSRDGKDNGAFTKQLKAVWGNTQDGSRFKGTYREFHSAILSSLPSTQSPNYFIVGTPNRAFEAQQPFTI